MQTLAPTPQGLNLPSLQTYGIVERECPPLVDMVISYELGDLNEKQANIMFEQLKAKGEHKLIKKLRKVQQ